MGRRHCGSKNTADGCTDERRPSAERAAAKFGCGIEASEGQARALPRRYRSDRAVQQAEDQSVGMKHSGLRGIPSVDKLALALGDMGLPHPTVVAAIRRELAALRKNHVVISRGELIQIGGGFRIPEILEASGAQLREVGTTNKTSLTDFARAIKRETALILRVHRSNFFMDGFVESPSTVAIAKLARDRRVPFVEDLGSGAMIHTETIHGLEHEPTPAEALRNGVDLVCFSGDKLFGGPQSGIIVGKAKLVAALKREPLFRALRCDKLILAALEATVEIYLRNSTGNPNVNDSLSHQGIPLLAMLHTSNDELRARAGEIIASLDGLPLQAAIGKGRAQIGGGALPRSIVQSTTLDIAHNKLRPQELAARLRSHTPPIVGYIARGQLKLDLRTVFPNQDREIVAALCAAI